MHRQAEYGHGEPAAGGDPRAPGKSCWRRWPAAPRRCASIQTRGFSAGVRQRPVKNPQAMPCGAAAYLMGNHIIAGRMYRRDPAVMRSRHWRGDLRRVPATVFAGPPAGSIAVVRACGSARVSRRRACGGAGPPLDTPRPAVAVAPAF